MAGEQGVRLAVALREPLPWRELVELVRTAEDTGYEAVFVPESAGREGFTTLSGLATATSRIALGTGVVPMENRSPLATAMAATTVHELSGGRLLLGLGSGRASITEFRGYASDVMTLLEGGEVRRDDPHHGTVAQRLAFRPDGDRVGGDARGGRPEMWFAALGDRAVALAGESADGVLLNWCTPERVARASETVASARREGGRPFTVAVYVRAALQGTPDGDVLDALALQTATYASMPHYRRQFEAMGLGQEARAAAEALARGRVGDVPEALVDAVCVRGGREDLLARADALRRAGAHVVVVYPVPLRDPVTSMTATILAAAPQPAVER